MSIALPLLDAMMPAGTALRRAKRRRAQAAAGRDGNGPRRGRQHLLRREEQYVVAGRRRVALRSLADRAGAARAVPRLPDHRQQHRLPQRRSVHGAGNRRRSLPIGGGVPDAVAPAPDAGLGRPRRHLARSDLREAAGQDTPIPSMQLCIESIDQSGGCFYGYSCAYTDSISWGSPTEPLPMIRDPRAVFDQLFGVGATPEARARAGARTRASSTGSVARSRELKAGARRRRPRAPGRLPRRRARDRAAHPESRSAQRERRGARAAGGADRRARFVRRAREADVRPAGGGVRRRHHARVRASS